MKILSGLLALLAAAAACRSGAPPADAPIRAGAAKVDVTPERYPVIVNGGFLAATAGKAESPLHVRALALDDGSVRLAIAVVDSCMLPRELLDEAKEIARKATGLAAERMLVSATHTHSAPSAMGCLGTPLDAGYAATLPAKIARAIGEAVERLAPARVGWAVAPAPDHTHCRTWIRRPDRMLDDPFGGKTVRNNMHPGYQSPDVVGPSGPSDPDLSLLSVQTAEGRPLALLANYSMHYFGAPAVSADYFGVFCRKLEERARARDPEAPFVAILSQGTSGDQHWMDYGGPRKAVGIEEYAEALAGIAEAAARGIEHREAASLAMAEAKLRLRRRVADDARLRWARGIVEGMGGRPPKTRPEVYAHEQLILAAEPERELKLQAIRIGELGIAAIPDEVYAITGLKIKAQSPLAPAFTIELANGSEGYIPPPELFPLGGYNTWAARTAGLEAEAEPKIVEAVLRLLEDVSGRKRRPFPETRGAYEEAVAASRPVAYWRMGEFTGPGASERAGRAAARYEEGVVFALPGPDLPGFAEKGRVNRAPHFAGGRMRARLEGLGDRTTVEFWFWNGLPERARPVTGFLFSRGADRLGIGGSARDDAAGKLFLSTGPTPKEVLAGRTPLALRTWHHVALVRDGRKVRVHLDGASEPEISGETEAGIPPGLEEIFIGGSGEGADGLEGKVDEAAVYDRALPAEEIARHVGAARGR